MNAKDVEIGGTYQAKVSDRVVTIRIDRTHPSGGWEATNLHTDKKIRIKTAGRLRAAVGKTRKNVKKENAVPDLNEVTNHGEQEPVVVTVDNEQATTKAKSRKAKLKEHRDQLNAQIKAETQAKATEETESEPVAKDAEENAPVANVVEPVAKKLSALDAAAQVLANSDVPMTCKELIEAMATQGLWSSPKGRTPENTLYAAVTREVNVKKEESRFRKVSAGHFASNQA
jgi:hypothetical protein